ncbi:MAG: hemolysin family protein [Acidimicrobiia bacterium]
MNLGAIGFALLLVLVNGFFVAVEFAFTASRRQLLEEMADGGSRFARLALRSMSELPTTFAGAQLGVAGASLALGFVMEPALAQVFEGLLEFTGLPNEIVVGIGVVAALLVASFIHNVFGEMAPKNATIAAPERVAVLVAGPFRLYVTILRPILVSLTWFALGLLRLFGVEPRQAIESTHSAADIASLVKTVGAGGLIEDTSSRLLTAAVGFHETLVSEVMVPRPDLVALPATSTPEDFERTVVATGHSRIPVYRTDLDDLEGFVHAKDLLTVDGADRTLPVPARIIRVMLTVPESLSVSPVMEMMKTSRTHIAAAVDEYGSTAGLITLEDIAEELVGEIRDEHDIRELMQVRPAGRDRYLVAGQTRVDRLGAQGIELPEGAYETVGGFVMDQLGRIPRRGDIVTTDKHEIGVRRMDGRRVREVAVRSLPSAGTADTNDSGPGFEDGA